MFWLPGVLAGTTAVILVVETTWKEEAFTDPNRTESMFLSP